MAKVTLNIEKLGGVDDFRIVTQNEINKGGKYKQRYVCTYFADQDEDQFADKNYDIIHITNRHDPMDQEYVAIEY